jgi:hypothetical protein
MSLGSASDLAFMLKDAGVSVVFNGITSTGILDRADAFQPSDGGAMLQVRTTTLLIATGVFTHLRSGAAIVVEGRPYKINAPPELQDDGGLTLLTLADAS